MTKNKGNFEDLVCLNHKFEDNTNSEVYAHKNTTCEDVHAHNLKILENIKKIYIDDLKESTRKLNQVS